MKKTYTYSFVISILFFCFIPRQAMCLSGETNVHDPSAIIRDGDKYWMFSTGNGINAFYSNDLFNWKLGHNTIFEIGKWPSWINSYVPGFAGSFWAPDVVQLNNKYYLYYSCSLFGSPTSVIGLATSPTLDQNSPDYKWTDQGVVVSSVTHNDVNAIDPSILKDSDGKVYLTYGSFSDGIGVIELDASTGKVKAGAGLYRVAGGEHATWEAPCIVKEGAYYYLFANRANCCNGAVSTYYIVGGRSLSPFGPFYDKNGINLRGTRSSAGGTPVIVTSGNFVGPGHFGLLRENGRNIVSLHYYDGNNEGKSKLDIASLQFTEDDWPIITRNYLPAGRYKITNMQSNLVLEAPECQRLDGRNLILNKDNNSACQEWDLTPVGNGYYKISNDDKNNAIDVPNCSAFNGTNLHTWSWLNNACQKFKIEQLANGEYIFTTMASSTGTKVIEASVASAGTSLNLFDYRGSGSQKWNIKQLSSPEAVSATNVTDSGFTATWNAANNAAAYRLDVFSTFSNAAYRTLAAWDFKSGTNKAGTGITENIGRQISVTGTDTAIFNAKGNGGLTARATGWDFETPEKYWEISFTTANYYSIGVSSKQRSSTMGPRHFKLQYKIGDNGTYTDIPDGLVSNLDNYTAGVINRTAMPEECENQPLVYVRWLLVTSTNLTDVTIENTGENNIDDIVITGHPGNFVPGFNNLLVKDTVKALGGLPAGTDFFYRVRSVQGSFTSVNSKVINVTTTGTSTVSFDKIYAEEKQDFIQVTWTTSPEKNVVRYEVERSVDGRWFTQIGMQTLSASRNLSSIEKYHFDDITPFFGDNYYRIKAVLTSGIVKYSATVKVYREKGENGVFFYPNPFDGKSIFVQFSNAAKGVNKISLLNSIGQEVYKKELSHAGGSINFTLFLANLSSGVYYFRVINGDKKTSHKVVVHRR